MAPRRSARLSCGVAPSLIDNPALAKAPRKQKVSSQKRVNKECTSEKDRKRAKNTADAAAAPKREMKENASVPATMALKREDAAWAEGRFVVGCDEAGRGPLAGPVVAAACSLPEGCTVIPGVGDSKTITDELVREVLFEKIIAIPGIKWSARVVSAARIDEINILMASLEAMRLSVVDVLGSAASFKALALIDGPFSPWKEGEKYVNFQQPQPPSSVDLTVEPVKGGDGKIYSIAVASIIAKVVRDRLMHKYHEAWPMYGLGQHKGYPTAAHVAAISRHGVSAIHRRTFAPLKTHQLSSPSQEEMERIEEIASSNPQTGGCVPCKWTPTTKNST